MKAALGAGGARRLISLCLAACTWPAAAAERPLWELGLGVAGLSLPHYRGADQTHSWLLPLPYAVYRGPILKADREGARAVLFDTRRLDVDVSLSAGVPTDSRDNDARAGMDDLAPTVELGPNLSWTAARGDGWKLELRVPVRAVLTVESSPRWIGWRVAPNVNIDFTSLLPGWNVGLQAGPLYADRRLHRYYYEVDDEDARPDRPRYRAAGGAAGAHATISASRRFERYWVGMFARYDSVAGAAFEDSPLVRRRSQASFGIAVAWVLATSSRRVVTSE